MCNFPLRSKQVGNVAYIETASDMAKSLVNRETRGPGDLDNAMRRVETKYGVPYATLWALRYRKPKDIMISAFMRITEAYEAQRLEQIRRFEHEKSITEIKGRVSSALVRAGDALAGAETQMKGE